jgi:hypothetical protein
MEKVIIAPLSVQRIVLGDLADPLPGCEYSPCAIEL